MAVNLFKRKNYVSIQSIAGTNIVNEPESEPSIPDGMCIQCRSCKTTIYKKEIGAYNVCPKCGYHFRLGWNERISLTCDEGSFEEMDFNIVPKNPMNYPDYENVIKRAQIKANTKEGVVTGHCMIEGTKTIIAIMDSYYMMGSMGSVVGEKITRAFELATKEKLPIVIFTTSGGARMQEGITSLMQMAKVSAAVSKHNEAGLLYITVLTDPTTGGVTASFAMLGDIILSEPKALIGFAGQRVIQDTIKKELPEGFQRAEFQLEHGFVDKIVERKDMKTVLGRLLKGNRVTTSLNRVTVDRDPVEVSLNPVPAAVPAAMDIVKAARDIRRPTALEFINTIFDDFIELHGDRLYKDDNAIVGGIATLNGMQVTVIGIQKGHTLEENIKRSFGSPNPEGYRKALRLMKQAEKFNRPVITFINTSGAYCGIEAEERGQGEAIARNLMEMASLKTPVISILIGEGGSGGALALAAGDRVWMLENSMYAILSPEGFASILWRNSGKAAEAAQLMQLTASDLLAKGVIEKIIPEANEGIDVKPEYTMDIIKDCLIDELAQLYQKDVDSLLEERYSRFRKFGEFQE